MRSDNFFGVPRCASCILPPQLTRIYKCTHTAYCILWYVLPRIRVCKYFYLFYLFFLENTHTHTHGGGVSNNPACSLATSKRGPHLVEQAAEHEPLQAGRPDDLGDGVVEPPPEREPPQPGGERNAVDGAVKPATVGRTKQGCVWVEGRRSEQNSKAVWAHAQPSTRPKHTNMFTHSLKPSPHPNNRCPTPSDTCSDSYIDEIFQRQPFRH